MLVWPSPLFDTMAATAQEALLSPLPSLGTSSLFLSTVVCFLSLESSTEVLL